MPTTAPTATRQSDLVRAARRESVTRTPVWFMRQAGRSLPEYRAVREGIPMLESCMRPDLVTEITLQPVRRHGVDAAIFFSDIVVPLKAIGVDLDIVPGVGPVVARPIRTAADLDQLVPLTPEHVPFVTEAVGQLVRELGDIPLIGFAGAPFTLASYLVEGGPSKNHEKTKALMHGDPDLWDALCARLAQISGEFLRVQALAGASAVQLFDSWAGALSRADYAARAMPHSAVALAHGRGPRRAPHPLRGGHGRAAGSHGRGRGRGGRGRLPRVARPTPSTGSGRRMPCRATSTRPCCSRRGTPLERRVREIVEEGRARAGPHLQPRSRRAAERRPRRAHPGDRARPRVLEPPMTTAAPSVARSSLTMLGGSVASRVLGVVRNGLITFIIGAQLAGDAFSLANTLPNVLYVLAAGGILNAVLIPSLARAMKLEDGGQEFTDRVITVALAGMALITVVVMAGAGGFVWLLARSSSPQFKDLALAFSLICLPQIFFYGLFALLGQVLNARGQFGAFAWAPFIANVVAVAGLVLFLVVFGQPHHVGPNRQQQPRDPSEWTGPMIWLFAGSATLSVVVQALSLVPALRRTGFHYRPRWGLRESGSVA